MLQRRALGLVVRRAVPLGDLINGGMAKQLIEKTMAGDAAQIRIRFESSQVKSIQFESKNGCGTKVVLCLEGKIECLVVVWQSMTRFFL